MRGRVDLTKIGRNWEDILRVTASIYTGAVRAYDVVAMLQRDGHPTALGEAIASYGRIFKTLHILSYIDTDESYRRDIKDIRNLQENRHSLARKICHGKKGELYHHYERGLENQLGALGLVLNCVTLWTTRYLDAAVTSLQAQGTRSRMKTSHVCHRSSTPTLASTERTPSLHLNSRPARSATYAILTPMKTTRHDQHRGSPSVHQTIVSRTPPRPGPQGHETHHRTFIWPFIN
ncbi:transposase for transposon Tn4556 (plasmid) [Arthrobacter sp. Hiyo8]|nr:transposase for transposon Tn4556 [Arthrobacter sp. Hiyo8]